MTKSSMPDLLSQVAAARQEVLDEGRPDAVKKRRDRNLPTARERVKSLLDSDSFQELGALVQPERGNEFSRDLQAPADGIVTGTGRIDGRAVNVAAHDYTVQGGSSGMIGRRKLDRLMERSLDRGLPLVMMLEGGGHRIQDGMSSAHFAGAGPVFQTMSRMSGWVPSVALMLGQGFAGPTNYAALADFVVMVKGQSTMGMAGPALVKAGTGIEIDKESLGGVARQADKTGIADLAVESEADALSAAGRFLSYLPANALEQPPIAENIAASNQESLLNLVPADSRKVYDVRKVIAVIADQDSVFEIKPRYARNIVTCFVRLGGRPVGVIANQSQSKAGVLDAPASEKAAHFIAMCDAFGLPLVFLIDVPGFSIGPAAEDTGLGRRSGRMFFELGIATVPRISIVLRKGYGGGYFAMAGGRSFDADAAFAWPTAEICAMSIEGAVDVAFRRQFQDADDPAATRAELIEKIRTQTGAINSLADFGLDDVIDPRETRRILIETFATCPLRHRDKNPPRIRPISPI
ncbi:MAG: acyl-CoA carboxylase [Alphaproteobacteria bacterium]|nr:acyl-CoA carboxylase [Alphaproteobacteria bacterium]